MSVIMDFSFNNPLIKNYFEGSDEYIPVAELMYVHSHPLIHPNFLHDIERLLNQTLEVIVRKNIKGGLHSKFLHLTQSLGKLLPLTAESNAAEALTVLREIYVFCNKIIARR